MSDYIKREDVLNMDFRISVRPFESRVKTAERAVQAYANEISKIPAADVAERKTCYDTEESRIFRCSECGYGVNDIFEDMDAPVHLFERFEHWRFCPCCGAQIKEGYTNAGR